MKFNEEEKAMWLEDWKRSGKSAWTYAKASGLNPQTFMRWTKAEAEEKPCLVEIPAQVISTARETPEILIEKGDVRIHIPLAAGYAELRAAMEWLWRVL